MLIDTDVLIWYMRGKRSAADFLDAVPSKSISAVTYMELVQGMRNKEELLALRNGLREWKCSVLHITDAISHRAVIYVERHFLAHSLRLADALIGATAFEHSLPLATANHRHYRVIEDLVIERFRP
jgi:hypothetical protein